MGLEEKFKKFIEDISQKIPGFNGYYRKEERRENDRRLRNKIVDKLREIKVFLEERGRKITKTGELDALDRIGQVGKRLEKLIDTINYADYGYSGFFDRKEVSEEKLESIYQSDLQLLEWIREFVDDTDEESDIEEISDGIDSGFEYVKLRKEIIEGD